LLRAKQSEAAHHEGQRQVRLARTAPRARVFRWAVKQNYLFVNPVTDIEKVRVPKRSLSRFIRMTTTSRRQQRSDHRLGDLIQRTGDLTIATDLGIRRSTGLGGSARRRRSWLVGRKRISRSRSSGRRSCSCGDALRSLRPCSGWRSPCDKPPATGSQKSGCRTLGGHPKPAINRHLETGN